MYACDGYTADGRFGNANVNVFGCSGALLIRLPAFVYIKPGLCIAIADFFFTQANLIFFIAASRARICFAN